MYKWFYCDVILTKSTNVNNKYGHDVCDLCKSRLVCKGQDLQGSRFKLPQSIIILFLVFFFCNLFHFVYFNSWN
jgi:hypothetical protein